MIDYAHLTAVSFEEEQRVDRLLNDDPFKQLIQFQTTSSAYGTTLANGAMVANEVSLANGAMLAKGATLSSGAEANTNVVTSAFSAYVPNKPHKHGMNEFE